MRKKSKIFIASSQGALQLAKAVKNKLDTKYSEATIWSEVKKGVRFVPEKLMQAAEKDFDFAVIILIKDDSVLKAGGDQGLREGTYNCISEAGLFMGTLGVERCFLVSSVEHEDVPSDLHSMEFYKLAQPKDLADFDSCQKVIDDSPNIDSILKIMQEKGSFTKRLRLDYLDLKDLLDRQKLKRDYGELHEGCQVIYLMNQPFFGNTEQLSQNMPKVSYFYFIPAEDIFITERMVDFLQGLLGANIIKMEGCDGFIQLREYLMKKEYQGTVVETLKDIVNHNCLHFCFFPVTSTFQFVIHNAGTADAKTYIKFDDQGFLEWMKDSDKANSFANSILDLLTQPEKKGIFHSTLFFNLHDDKIEQTRRFKASIERELKRYFPGIHEQVTQLCFEGKLE